MHHLLVRHDHYPIALLIAFNELRQSLHNDALVHHICHMLGPLDSDRVTTHVINIMLQLGLVNLAMKWYSRRFTHFSLAPNASIINYFSAHYKKINKDLREFWIAETDHSCVQILSNPKFSSKQIQLLIPKIPIHIRHVLFCSHLFAGLATRDFDSAIAVLEYLPRIHMNPSVLDVVLMGLVKRNQMELVIQILLGPDTRPSPAVIKLVCESFIDHKLHPISLLRRWEKEYGSQQTSITNVYVAKYLAQGEPNKAIKMATSMPRRNVVTSGLIIQAYAQLYPSPATDSRDLLAWQSLLPSLENFKHNHYYHTLFKLIDPEFKGDNISMIKELVSGSKSLKRREY
eukprot:gene17869-21308_t